MSTKSTGRAAGLVALVKDGVVHGTSAVERVHMETAARPFAILEAIPVVRLPTHVVHVAHDAIVRSVYASIRIVAHLAGSAGAAVAGARAEGVEPKAAARAEGVEPKAAAAEDAEELR
jgi:hypothetical protein